MDIKLTNQREVSGAAVSVISNYITDLNTYYYIESQTNGSTCK
jgi:hypothetical protein